MTLDPQLAGQFSSCGYVFLRIVFHRVSDTGGERPLKPIFYALTGCYRISYKSDHEAATEIPHRGALAAWSRILVFLGFWAHLTAD